MEFLSSKSVDSKKEDLVNQKLPEEFVGDEKRYFETPKNEITNAKKTSFSTFESPKQNESNFELILKEEPRLEEGKSREGYFNYVGGVAGAAALSAVATAFHRSPPKLIDNTENLAHQALIQPGPDQARISLLCQDGKLKDFFYDNVCTLHDVMIHGSKMSGNGRCLGSRKSKDEPYKFLKFEEVMKRSLNFGCGLMHLGLNPGQDTFVGIYVQNSVEWILTEQACYYFSAVLVPLYDTLGPMACTFIINQASITTVVCDKEEKIRALLSESSATPVLKTIIATCEVSNDIEKMATEFNVKICTFQKVEKLGAKNPREPLLPSTDDLATVCYTSGTTGNPKGVMLTHKNIVADVSALLLHLGPFGPTPNDIIMSFLPCAHMFERVCEIAVLMNGGSIGFFLGDIKGLMDDFQALKPTITPSVPRLLNRIYDQVNMRVNSSKFKSWLFKKAMSAKTGEINRYIIRNNSIWDNLVFKKVRDGMGGRLRVMVCGSAPLAGNVLTFIRCALGCIVLEGYGQTECVAPCTLALVGDPQVEHVGPPIPCCAIKLADVPEMNCFASEGKGEVCIKGYNVFKGYLKDPEKTSEAIDEEGWLHTGDIGVWLPNNSLKIVDRKKHIFKLAQGEYIAPEKIENIYLTSKYVSQIFVHGESLKACLVAIVCPDNDAVESWAKSHGITGTWKEICNNKEVKKQILDDMTALGRKGGLKSFEQVKDVYLFADGFTIQNGLLTPTLKIKRPDVKKYFSQQIETMYRTLA